MAQDTLQDTNQSLQDKQSTEQKLNHPVQVSQEPLDVGPAVSLDDFIVAAYMLNPNKLRYNWLGRLSELPPDAFELSIRLRNQVKITPDGLVGYKAELAGSTCANLSEKEKDNSWKFPICSYLEEAEKIEFCKSTNCIALYFKRLFSYSFIYHLKSYAFLTNLFTAVTIAFGFIMFFIALFATEQSLNKTLLFINYIPNILLSFAGFCAVFYIALWRLGINYLESPRKNKNYTPSVNLDEIRKWIIISSKAKNDWQNEAGKIINNALIASPNNRAENSNDKNSNNTTKEDTLSDHISSLRDEDFLKIFKPSTYNLLSIILLMLTGKLLEQEKTSENPKFRNTEEALEHIVKEIDSKKLHLFGVSRNSMKVTIAKWLKEFSTQRRMANNIDLNNDESYKNVISKWINITKKKDNSPNQKSID